jgi:hypothetical protein
VDRRAAVTAGVVAIAAALGTGLVIFTLRREPPPFPPDLDHPAGSVAADCLACHGPAGGRPRGRNHPLNDQCLNCHDRG